MKTLKLWIVISILCVVLIFMGLDKCGSLKKVSELKGQFEEANRVAQIERVMKEVVIEEQTKEIIKKNAEIIKLSGEVIKTNKDLIKVTGEFGELKKEFTSLEECQVQYNKLAVAFNFAMSIVEKIGMPIEYYDEFGIKQVKFPEGSITFGLNEKYEKQVKISLAYKDMYESSENLLRIQIERVVELEKINNRVKFASKIKTGIALVVVVVIIGVLT